MVWLAVLVEGLGAHGGWSTWPGDAAIAPLIVLVALIGAATLWIVEDPEATWLQRGSFLVASATVLYTEGISIRGRSYYSTDSAAFNQIAAKQLLGGHNPYASSMAHQASELLHGVSSYWTYTLGGGHVAAYSYPAGSFLLQVPLRLLGVHRLSTDWIDLIAAIAAAGLLFFMLPRWLRWLAPALLFTSTFIGSFASGGTDALVLPFLLLAVYRWDRFALGRAAGWQRFVAPISLGLACAIKQTPWFCVPFLLIGIGIEARAWNRSALKVTGTYAALVGGTFLALNLPFIIWNASAWLHGTLLPLTRPLIPDGQGLVVLAVHGIVRGVHLPELTAAGALAELSLLLAYVLWYRRLKRVWLFLVPLVLFVPGRSLSEYLVDFFPVALVAAFSVAAPAGELLAGLGSRARAAIVAVPVLGVIILALLSFSSPVLDVHVDRVRTTDRAQVFHSMTLTLTNRSAGIVHPHVMVLENGTHPAGFWHLANRARISIQPQRSTTVTLYPPPWTWTSLRGQYWLVEVFTPSPAALSTSVPQLWRHGHY